jgi:opacity protein-like surface antigen
VDTSGCLNEACFRAQARAVAHELLGGLRLNASNSSRATPYLVAGGGLVRASASGSGPGFTLSTAKVKPALGIGGGMDFRLGGPVAAIFDLRVVKASELRVYARASFGVGFRLK